MELFHIHLVGNHDRLYKEKSEFVVDKNKFNNRLYNRIYNANSTVDVNRYKQIVDYINILCQMSGIPQFENKINLGEIIEFALKKDVDNKSIIKILEDSKNIILAQGINLREMAMEEYRKENCVELPSRLHSLFACSKEGLDFWIGQIRDNDVEIFRIDVYDEPFVSNEILLPHESLDYGDKIKSSYKYFHPSKKDLNPITNEYLVQGKVKIKERII